MRIASGLFMFAVLVAGNGCKTRGFNSSNDSVNHSQSTPGDSSQRDSQDRVGDPSCASYETVVEEYQNGAKTWTDYVRLKIKPQKWQGKDINGAACELTIDSTAISSSHYQMVNFSAKFNDFNLPRVFRNVQEGYIGLANDLENGAKVDAKAKSLSDDPGTLPNKTKLVEYAALFGPLSAGSFSPINKVIRLSVSKQTCAPVFVIVQSSYPLERKANICVF